MQKRKSFRIVAVMLTVLAIPALILCSCSLIAGSWTDHFFKTGSRDVSADRASGKRFAERVRMRPGNAEAHYRLGVYYQRGGRHVEAIAQFNKALDEMPDSVQALNGLGISYDCLGDHLSAVRSFRQALAIHPSLDYALNNLCYSLARWGNAESAISTCRQALSQNGENIRIRNNLALALAMAGHYDQAFEELLSAGGNHLSAHLNMASIYFEKAMFGKAAHHYSQAFMIDPSSDAARKGLAASEELIRIAGMAQQHREAEAAAERKEQLKNPPEPQAVLASPASDIARAADHLDKARTYYEKGEFEQAGVQYRLAVSLNPVGEEARRGVMASEALAQIVAAPPAENNIPQKDDTAYVNKLLFEPAPAGAGIEISNGNGENHMARDVAGYLKNRGFKIVRITNAHSFRHAAGVIYYKPDHLKTALSLAAQIEPLADLQQVDQLGSRRVNVKVLLGKDMIAYKTMYRN